MLANLSQYYVSSFYHKITRLLQINVMGIGGDGQVTVELITVLLDNQKEKVVPQLIHVKIPCNRQNGCIFLSNIDRDVPMLINYKESEFLPEVAEMIDENMDVIKTEILDLLNSG